MLALLFKNCYNILVSNKQQSSKKMQHNLHISAVYNGQQNYTSNYSKAVVEVLVCNAQTNAQLLCKQYTNAQQAANELAAYNINSISISSNTDAHDCVLLLTENILKYIN